jgi:hypothetical protein
MAVMKIRPPAEAARYMLDRLPLAPVNRVIVLTQIVEDLLTALDDAEAYGRRLQHAADVAALRAEAERKQPTGVPQDDSHEGRSSALWAVYVTAADWLANHVPTDGSQP